jgi:hypothetical protein
MAALHDAIVPFRDNDNIGIGVDSTSGDRKGLVVNPVTGTPKDAGGSTSEFNIIRIFQTSDLETALNIDANASAGIAAFAGGSARFDFAKQMQVQSSSLFMAITALVRLASESIDVPTLADQPAGGGAASMVDNNDVFAQRYGDMFVRSFQRGGFYVGVLQIDTTSSSEADQIAASLGGSYELFSATASTKLQTVSSQYQGQVFVHQYSEGGTILQIGGDPTQLVASVSTFLQSFQNTPDAVAVPFNCSLAPVTIAAGPLPPNDEQRGFAREVLVECAQRRSATMDLLNLVQFISDHNSEYDFSTCPMATITNSIVGFQSDLDIIAKCASNAIDHPLAALMPAEFASHLTPPVAFPTNPPNPLPVRKPVAPATGPDLSRFVGTWNNTNSQGHISVITLAPLDALRLSAKAHITSLLFSQVQHLPSGGQDFEGHVMVDSEQEVQGLFLLSPQGTVVDPAFGVAQLCCYYYLSSVAGDPQTIQILYTEVEVPVGPVGPGTPQPRVMKASPDVFKKAG